MIRRLLERIGAFLDGTGVRWTVGVALPIFMIAVDPAVFHSRVTGVGMPLLGALKPFCYVATGVALVAFVAWLIRPQASAFASGAFAGAALFAVFLGTAILPFSLLGILLLGLGLLGLSPFLMAAVYWQAARAAFPSRAASNRRWLFFSAGMVALLGIPSAMQGGASRAYRQSLADITSAETAAVARGTERLRHWSPLLDLERLVAAYTDEQDAARRSQIAATYHQLTGQDAAARAEELVD
jgi:hypothetical protein